LKSGDEAHSQTHTHTHTHANTHKTKKIQKDYYNANIKIGL